MKLNDLGVDRIKTFGQPYHGLWKAGSIALPNSTSKTCPAPGNGGVVLLRVPGQPAVSRTAPELAADATAGREWRNYGLISGGRYGASDPVYGPPGTATVIFIDGADVSWLMHITWASTNSYMVVKLRRFGHFETPWEATSWSSTINVTVYPDFRYALVSNSLLTVCQNTTGGEFVLGAVSLAGVDDYCYAMIKVTVTGTVDLSASDFDLTFGGTSLGGPAFDQGTRIVHEEVVGDTVDITTTLFNEHDSSIPGYTGIVVTQTDTVTNGALVTTYSPYPPTPSGSLTYIYASTSRASSSDQVITLYDRMDITIAFWAAYVEDSLKLLTARMLNSVSDSSIAISFYDYGGPGGAARWQKTHTQTNNNSLSWEYAGAAVFSKIANQVTVTAAGLGSGTPGLVEHTVTSFGFSLSGMLTFLNGAQGNITPVVYDAPVVFPLTVSGVSWSTPCLACVSRLGYGTYTWSTQKVIAPSGAYQTTSTAISSLSASWQPALDQLSVDSGLICWF